MVKSRIFDIKILPETKKMLTYEKDCDKINKNVRNLTKIVYGE